MTSAIPLLRFRAGAVPTGVAARDVRTILGASKECPPLWRLLGLPPADFELGQRIDTWRLGLVDGDASAEILVQGPIEITEIRAGDLLRQPPALALSNPGLIIGFVRCAREVVLVLDIPALVQVAREGKMTHQP